MTLEANFRQDGGSLDFTPAVAVTGGKVVQVPDGRAGVCPNDIAAGALGSARVRGVFRLQKTANINILAGGKVFWDASAGTATFRTVNDRDFFVGAAIADSLASQTYVDVALNVEPRYLIDVLRDAALSVATGTAAAGGFGLPQVYGNARALTLTATSEVQCVDILSVDRFAVGANAIVEGIFRVGVNGSTNAVDFNIGIANGTSASDADAITEHVLLHIDGGSTAINVQSKDGTTTVAATDTTLTITAGSAVANRKEVWIDTRDPANVKVYVDGVRVLDGTTGAATTVKLDAAAGPLGIITHLEKSTGTATAGPIYIDALRARIAEQ